MQEKLDHAAIVALIIGTPLTAIMAQADGELPKDIILSVICMGISSLLPPTLRVVGFILGPIVWSFRHLELLTPTMCTEIALYLFGAASFLRSELNLSCHRHLRADGLPSLMETSAITTAEGLVKHSLLSHTYAVHCQPLKSSYNNIQPLQALALVLH